MLEASRNFSRPELRGLEDNNLFKKEREGGGAIFSLFGLVLYSWGQIVLFTEYIIWQHILYALEIMYASNHKQLIDVHCVGLKIY